jgi:aerobic-type carbon monoxide dehydrogenase small subunit (CoxS/CutS family)
MSNTYIPFYVQEYIDNFYCLKGKNYNFKVLSKEHEKFKINKCKVHRYKNLCACEIHDNNDKVDAITILIDSTKLTNISTIHFKTKKSLNYAKRYLEYFGNVSHYCCGGTGVMYLAVLPKYCDGYSVMGSDFLRPMRIPQQSMRVENVHIFRGPTAKQAMHKYVQKKTFNKRKMKLKVIKNKCKRKKFSYHHKRYNRQKRQLYGKSN